MADLPFITHALCPYKRNIADVLAILAEGIIDKVIKYYHSVSVPISTVTIMMWMVEQGEYLPGNFYIAPLLKKYCFAEMYCDLCVPRFSHQLATSSGILHQRGYQGGLSFELEEYEITVLSDMQDFHETRLVHLTRDIVKACNSSAATIVLSHLGFLDINVPVRSRSRWALDEGDRAAYDWARHVLSAYDGVMCDLWQVIVTDWWDNIS